MSAAGNAHCAATPASESVLVASVSAATLESGYTARGCTKNWFTYHYYDANNNGTATLGLNRLYWDTNNWPVVTNDWSAFYPFDVDARDHRGNFSGALLNSTMTTNDPARGRVLCRLNIQYIRS